MVRRIDYQVDDLFSRNEQLKKRVEVLERQVRDLEGNPQLRTRAQMQDHIAQLTVVVKQLMEEQ